MSKILSGELIGKRESVTDQLLLLNAYQVPLITMLGFSDATTQVEHQWYEDSMFGTKSVVTAAASASATSVTVADDEPFRVNQVVEVNEELLLVTAVNAGTKVLTVTRGYGGTTAASIAEGTEITVQFVEGSEGADARAARYKARVRKSKLTQIFDDTVEISGTAAAVSNYGIDDLYEYEKDKKLLELGLQLEKALIGGVRYENGTVRQMGGLRKAITTNVRDLAGAALSLEAVSDSLQSIYTKGGFNGGGNYEILVPATQKRVVSKFSDNAVQIERADGGRGTVVSYVTTDFGVFPVSINDNLKADEALIIDKNRTMIRPLKGREFTHEYLGKKGDYYAGQIVGEYTLELHQESAHARIKGAAK